MTCVIVQFCSIKPLDSQKDMEDSDEEEAKDCQSANSLKRGDQEDSSPGKSETGPSQKRVKTE